MVCTPSPRAGQLAARAYPRHFARLGALLLAWPWLGWAQQPATSWSLRDQFGHVHTAAELSGKPVLIVAGGSVAARTFDAWIDATLAAFGGRRESLPFVVLGIADVGGAPRLLYPLIRRKLPRGKDRPVLVDPNGTISKQFGIDRGTSNQLVLGRDGAVLMHLRGIPVDTAGARRLAEQLRVAVGPSDTQEMPR